MSPLVIFVIVSGLVGLSAKPVAFAVEWLIAKRKQNQPFKPTEFWG